MKVSTQQYIRNIESGFIKTSRDKVLHAIYIISKDSTVFGSGLFDFKQSSIDTDSLQKRLNMSLATLTARLSDLQDEGFIKAVGQQEKGSSVYSKWTYVFDENERYELAEQRKNEKFTAWIDRGMTEFWDMLSLEVKINLTEMKDKRK